MAVDLKSELTRPPALILTALAVLGWVLFILSSWSAASVQKAQRMQIVQLSEKSDKLGSELAKQLETTGSVADLQAKIASMRDDLSRVSQTRNDVQAELTNAQRNLSATRRDISEADRSFQSQSQKLTDLQSAGEEAAAQSAQSAGPKSSRGRRSGRGRRSRSFSVRSR
jgi:septal ring factor EnvC (AmiA/AmiB activator)